MQLFHARRVLLRLFHFARRLPLEWEEKRIDEDGEENDSDTVTSGCFLQRIDGKKNRNGQRASHPSKKSIIDRFTQIDLSTACFRDLLAGLVEQPMIFGANIDFYFCTVSRHWEQAGNQKSLLGFVVRLVFVGDCAVLKSRNGFRRHGDHPKVRVANSGPTDAAADLLQISAFGPRRAEPTTRVSVNWVGGKTLSLAVDDSDAFRSNGVESVMLNPLIANAGPNRQLHLRQGPIVAQDFEFDFGAVSIGEKRDALRRIQRGGVIVNDEIDLLRTARNIDRFIA